MGKPYSSDLRQQFVAALDQGMSASAAGRSMRITRAAAARWAATSRRESRAEALPMGGDRRCGRVARGAPASAPSRAGAGATTPSSPVCAVTASTPRC